MKDFPWTVCEGNLTVRNNTQLPNYLTNASVDDPQTGIPYCKGGNYGKQEFDDKQDEVLSSGICRMTGNIKDVSGHQPQTLGLDCARFVGQALAFDSEAGYSPSQFINLGYGHTVDSVSDLLTMDVIISSTHAMFYKETLFGTVRVYDTTSGAWDAKTNERNTGYSGQELAELGYQFVHLYAAAGFTPTQHWSGCASCEEYRTYEDHTWEYTFLSDAEHTKTCTECGYTATESHGGPCTSISATQHVTTCMSCGHSVTENHDMNETYNLTMHTHYCTDCGYSVTASHAMEITNDSTSHWYRCTGCDYTNMNEAHTFSTTHNGITHTKTCSVCGYSTTAMHNFVYDYNADEHWQECTDCGYETTPTAHTYANSRCTVCNMQMLMKSPPVIAIPEEDEPLPVPEDQKETL